MLLEVLSVHVVVDRLDSLLGVKGTIILNSLTTS